MITYLIAEKFKSIQGEGLYAGTPMAFIRFAGCSVGKKICQHCDTDFEKVLPWQGGGEFTLDELLEWAFPYEHICLTGGEPLDQDLRPFFQHLSFAVQIKRLHIESSGTISLPDWFPPMKDLITPRWLCISPKPGFLEHVVAAADEVKVIVPGLGENASLQKVWELKPDRGDGSDFRWPTLADALRWADADKLVYLQPRNAKFDVDQHNLMLVKDLLAIHPQLRLSTQMHKILKVQ